MEQKQYIGDGIYADLDGSRIVLTTENGVTVTNIIYMDLGILMLFLNWMKRTEVLSEILTKALEE